MHPTYTYYRTTILEPLLTLIRFRKRPALFPTCYQHDYYTDISPIPFQQGAPKPYSRKGSELNNDDDANYVATSDVENLNIPTNFPRHTVVSGPTAFQLYLDSADYIVSLCSKPLPDLKYGIIVVLRGEEEMFLRNPEDTMPVDFKNEILAKRRVMRKQQEVEHREEQEEEHARRQKIFNDPELRSMFPDPKWWTDNEWFLDCLRDLHLPTRKGPQLPSTYRVESCHIHGPRTSTRGRPRPPNPYQIQICRTN